METTDDPASKFYPYACPVTHDPLRVTAKGLESPSAGQTYAIIDGIPNFLSYDAVETAKKEIQFENLNAVAREEGWMKALERLSPKSVKYVANDKRASFLHFLPITPVSNVLEIGTSLGQHTPLFAKKAGTVHGLEVVHGQALFTYLRSTQLGCDNVSIACGGDDCRLPYLSESFNVVVMNLVLEMCGGKVSDKSVLSLQKQFLAECYRVLVPGGTLFLATKNRYDLRLLAGGRDEHARKLRFGHALPRPLMLMILHLQQMGLPHGRIHSFGALKKYLYEAGFNRLKPLWAIPDARYPWSYKEFTQETLSALKEKLKNKKKVPRSFQALVSYCPISLIPWLAPSLVFLAYKYTKVEAMEELYQSRKPL